MKPKLMKYYMSVAKETAKLSHAQRKRVGAIIVKDDNIVSFGYNGTPSGRDNVCEINNTTKAEVIHAEANAILKIAKSNNNCDNSTLFVTMSPCFECSKMIVQSGIRTVVIDEIYRDDTPIKFLEECGITIINYNEWSEMNDQS